MFRECRAVRERRLSAAKFYGVVISRGIKRSVSKGRDISFSWIHQTSWSPNDQEWSGDGQPLSCCEIHPETVKQGSEEQKWEWCRFHRKSPKDQAYAIASCSSSFLVH